MKALIPAAGLGSRFLPVTRVIPKEMLPIGAKPALELIVEEAKAAGADETVIVVSPGKELIRQYFKDDPRVSFVTQTQQKGLGHAVFCAAEHFRGESDNILVLLGDALVSGCCASSEMVALSRANSGAGVIGLERVPAEMVSRYGIVALDDPSAQAPRITDIVEKPSLEEAPSDIAVAGRYLLDPSIFTLLADQQEGYGGEIQLTDAIRRLIREKPVLGYVYPGRRHDIGNPKGYFKTLEAMNANG